MDSAWLNLADQVSTARLWILIVCLCLLIPFSLIEIIIVQKFKVDRLFLYTCLFYTTCFSLTLIYKECLEDLSPDASPFLTRFLQPSVHVLQSTACLCLTYYILIIEFVKITIESMSPQIMKRRTIRHKKATWGIIGGLFGLLVLQAVLDEMEIHAANSIVWLIYCSIVSALVIRFIWIAKYFIDKKFSQKDDSQSKIVWVWILVALNIYVQVIRTLLYIPMLYGQLTDNFELQFKVRTVMNINWC